MKVRILSYNFLGSSEATCLGASQPRSEGIHYLSSYLGAFQIEFHSTSHVCWAIMSTGMERKDVHTLQACPLEILHMRLRNNCPLRYSSAPPSLSGNSLPFALCMHALPTDHIAKAISLISNELGNLALVFGCPITHCFDSMPFCEFIPAKFSLYNVVALDRHLLLKRHSRKTLSRVKRKPAK